MTAKKGAVLGGATAVMLAAVWIIQTFFPLSENAFYDRSFMFRRAPAPKQVVIVGIDAKSIGNLGAWPWPRSLLAKLADKINEAEPRAVAMDFLFPVKNESPQGDDSLSASFKKISRLVLPFRAGEIFHDRVDGPVALPHEILSCRFREILFPHELENSSFYYTKDVIAADSRFLSGAQYGGFLNVSTQKGSQNLREVIHVIRSGAEYFPSFGLAAAAAYDGIGHKNLILDGRGPSIRLKERTVAISSYAGSSLLNFRGKDSPVPTVSAADILSGTADLSRLKDKLVFTGITDPAAGVDFFTTPVSPQFPGVEIWATAASDILNGTWIRRYSGLLNSISWIITLVIFPGLAIFIPDRRRTLSAIAGLAVLCASFTMWAVLSSAANIFWDPGRHLYAWIFSILWLALQKANPALADVDIGELEPSQNLEADTLSAPKPSDYPVVLPKTATALHVAGKLKNSMPLTPGGEPVSTMVESNLAAAMENESNTLNEFLNIAQGSIIRTLGSGGMADVYLVWKPRLEIYRAVKVLKPESSSQVQDRFETEIRIFANLSHRNIVQCYEAGEWHGLPYIEMEYVSGSAMDSVLKKVRSINAAQTAVIGILVCRALDYAHKKTVSVYGKTYKGVIHRDLKPANIMLSSGGAVKLTDFGIARPQSVSLHTNDSTKVIGTLPYLAPEQLEGLEITAKTDIYALGITLYEFVTGERAYPQTDITTLVGAKTTGKMRSLKGSPLVPQPLAEVIEKATARDPAKRYQSCLEMGRALENCLKILIPGQNSGKPISDLLKKINNA